MDSLLYFYEDIITKRESFRETYQPIDTMSSFTMEHHAQRQSGDLAEQYRHYSIIYKGAGLALS